MSRIRTNLITNRMANGAPTVSNGLVISGVTTSTTFSGSGASLTNLPSAQLTGALPALDGSNLTGITQTTINNNADNRVITGSGTANTLNAESTLTWSGVLLDLFQNTTAETGLKIRNSEGSCLIRTNDDKTFVDTDQLIIRSEASSEYLRINSSGQIGIGANNNSAYDASARNLLLASSGNTGITIRSNASSNYGMIHFADGVSSAAEYRAGRLLYEHSTNSFLFYNANAFSLKIDGDGDVGIGDNSPNCRLAVKDVAEHTAYNFVTPSVGDCMMQLYNNPPNETANDHATIQFGVNGGSHNRVNTISAVAESAGNRKMAFTFCTDEASSRSEKMRITGDGKVGINSTSPQQALDVKGSINGGSVNQPFLRFHDSHGRQRNTKHYFKCVKGSTTIFDILTVDINQDFHQALIILYYGARIQAVADSVTYPVHKVIGVNRFNGGSIQFTKNTIVQNANVTNHADIDAVATSSTNYRIRLTYSGTAGGSSFCCGSVEIIGVGSGDDGCFYSLAHAHGLVA